MDARRKALLEAALMCSKYADSLSDFEPDWANIAQGCAGICERMADSPLHYYPPKKPVIDLGQDSENSYL